MTIHIMNLKGLEMEDIPRLLIASCVCITMFEQFVFSNLPHL